MQQDHLRLAMLVDGVFQVSCSSVEISFDSGAQPVKTLEGLAGKTQGSKMIEISGNWAVPIGGLEFNFVDAIANGTYHEVQIPIGAKSIIAKGWWQSGKLSQSVDANTEASATFSGQLLPLQ